MNTFPTESQQDLIVSSSVNWSNANKIIEKDEKEFKNVYDCNDRFSISTTNQDNLYNSQLDVSWGNYFALKSPPLGTLSGDGFIQIEHDKKDQKNQKNQQNISSELIDNKNNNIKIDDHDIKNNDISSTFIRDDIENNDMVVINIDNISKSLDNIDYSNRDSNSTQHTEISADTQHTEITDHDHHIELRKSIKSNIINKFIQIPSLKHIQRFYQFSINSDELDNNIDIQKQIELIILNYIDSYCKNTNINVTLSAITYKPKTKKCTVLILFDPNDKQFKDNQDWGDDFLSFSLMAKILDYSVPPFFTQLSSN